MEVIAKFSVPMRVNKNKHKIKWFYLSLNNFITVSKFPPQRNAIKKKYQELIKPILRALNIKMIDYPVKIEYCVYGKDKRLFDIDNTVTVSKFTGDAMVELGILKDDNYSIVREVSLKFGGIDKENPRAEVTIYKL